MKPFPIPVVAIGPGSQPVEETPQYIPSPGTMSIFLQPTPRAQASAAAVAGARAIIDRLLAKMEAFGYQGADLCVPLIDAEAEVVAEVNELLGHGEVSALVAAGRPIRIQESAFAGVWRVQTLREDGSLAADDIEAGAVPRILRQALQRSSGGPVTPPAPGPGVMNAPAILRELIEASAAYRPGADAHVVNLTLLPVTPEDLAYLSTHLGSGPVTILSRGYGNCRISSTALAHTWWVQYFNSVDQLILDTLEVDAVPVVALAAAEDFADSIVRMRDWIATL